MSVPLGPESGLISLFCWKILLRYLVGKLAGFQRVENAVFAG